MEQPQTASAVVEDLIAWTDAQPSMLGGVWISTLDSRKQEEAEFHDSDRSDHRDEASESTSNRKFYEAAIVLRRFVDDWIKRHAPGSVVLDYACGNGNMALSMARAGAALVVGIDISEVSIGNARENAAGAGLSTKTRFLQRDCENTGLPSGSFDVIFCSGMLHHLDLNVAFPELHRLLRPNGRVFCLEALEYNPVIQMYRNRTPHLRTDWEKDHILGMSDLRLAQRWFRVENRRFFLLAAPIAALLPAGVLRRAGLAIGHALDSILTRVPLLRLWSWQFSFELVRTD